MSIYRGMMFLAVTASALLLQNNESRGQAPSGGAVTVSAADKKFILDAAVSGLHEVQMAKLGVQNATGPNVKIYAQKILDDHALSNAELEALARLKGVTLPDPTKTDPATTNLSRLTGIDFDREFVKEAIDGHVKDLAEFEKEDQAATADSDIKGFAHSMLPKMRDHLAQAKALMP